MCLTLSVPVSSCWASSLAEPVRQQARQLAESTDWGPVELAPSTGNATGTARMGRSAGDAIRHPLGAQTLFIEKQESKQTANTTLVRVYQFHYELQQARLLVVNPDDNRIVKIQPIASVHLPLNPTEIAYATDLLAQRADILDTLRQAQIRRGRMAFDKLAELDVKASIYEPLDNQHTCYIQRCVLLSLFDETRTVFSTEPVINLQTLQVTLLDSQ